MDPAVDIFFFQAEDGIRELVRSRGLGDVYKRQQQYILPKVIANDAAVQPAHVFVTAQNG